VLDRVVNWLAKKIQQLIRKFLARFEKKNKKPQPGVAKIKKEKKLKWYQKLGLKRQSKARPENEHEDDWAGGL
jgi:hypothetical protein